MTLLSPEEMTEVFTRWQAENPEPASELEYVNPFTLLVAVVLSAQATDKSVNKATGPLFKIADTPEKMLALGEEGLISYIKTIGLYKNKAKHVIGLSQKLINDFDGQVPEDRDKLMTLPGVGETRAEEIIRYREQHGGFTQVEDLMNVNGIKEGTFNKLKDKVTT